MSHLVLKPKIHWIPLVDFTRDSKFKMFFSEKAGSLLCFKEKKRSIIGQQKSSIF